MKGGCPRQGDQPGATGNCLGFAAAGDLLRSGEAKSPKQVEKHVGAAEVRFSAEELERIEAILEDTPEG